METIQPYHDFWSIHCALQRGLNKLEVIQAVSEYCEEMCQNVLKNVKTRPKNVFFTNKNIELHTSLWWLWTNFQRSYAWKKVNSEKRNGFWVISGKMSEIVRTSRFTKMTTNFTPIEGNVWKFDTEILKGMPRLCWNLKSISSVDSEI